MKTVNYTELREHLKQNLDEVSDNQDTLIVHRAKGRSVVVISIDEYNAMKETMHLLRSKKNRERLEEAIKNVSDKKDLLKKKLIDE